MREHTSAIFHLRFSVPVARESGCLRTGVVLKSGLKSAKLVIFDKRSWWSLSETCLQNNVS